MKKQLIIIGMSLIFTIVGLSGCTETKPTTMTYPELWDDVNFIYGNTSFTLTSYKDGDVLYIKDKVLNVTYGTSEIDGSYVPITSIFFNSQEELPPPLCFLEDKRSEYIVGNTYLIPVHVKQYTNDDKTYTWLEEWYNIIYLAYGIPAPIQAAPVILFDKVDTTSENTLTVNMVDPNNVDWADIELRVNGTAQDHGMSGIVTKGDIIDISNIAGKGEYTVTIHHMPTDGWIGTQEFMGQV